MCGGQREVCSLCHFHTQTSAIRLEWELEGLPSSTYTSILMPQHRTIQALMRAGGYAVICYDEDSMRLDYFRKE